METPKTTHILLCDIGGTNCRFQLSKLPISDLPPSIQNFYFPSSTEAPPKPKESPATEKSIIYNPNFKAESWTFNEKTLTIIHAQNFPSQSFTKITDAFSKFFDTIPKEAQVEKKDIFACVSICGPVENQEVVSMANLGWTDVSGKSLKRLGFKDVYLSNDFEAFGYGLARASCVDQLRPLFTSRDLLNKDGELRQEAKDFGAIEFKTKPSDTFDFDKFFEKSQKKVLAVGIGTGVGTVMINSYQNFSGTKTHLEVLPSEASHCFFGFKNEQDIALVNYISKVRYKDLRTDYLPFDNIISGMSIPLIYSFLSESQKLTSMSSKEIFEKCIEGDALALKTVEYFLDLLGQFIHQTAICFLPEIVVLRGPLLDSLRKALETRPEMKWNFWRSLLAKTHMSPVYQNMTLFTVEERFNLSALGTVIMYAEKCGED
jgi:glucokinase